MCGMRGDGRDGRDVREGREKGWDAGGMKMGRGERMTRVRAQAKLVTRLSGQMREMAADGLKSPRLDGMPRGTGYAPGGLDSRVEKREAMLRLLERESGILREYETAARREMDDMRPELYAFCALYYLAGLSLEETANAIDRSERQCARYKREIEQGA